MTIAILAPSDRGYITKFLPEIDYDALPDGYVGAPWIGTIIEELLNENHKVIAITTTKVINADFEPQIFTSGNFTWAVVPVRRYSFRSADKKCGKMVDFFKHERNQMVEILKRYNPDFVHGFWSYEFAGAAVASRKPCLITIEDNAFKILYYFKNLYRLFRLIMSERILREVRFSSTVSPYMLDYAKSRCDFVKVIPNPVPIVLNLSKVEVLIKNRIGTIAEPKILMINNGWDARKNGKNGLIAFKQLLTAFPNASLHLYGNGSEVGGPAERDAKSIGLSDVKFHGVVNHNLLIDELKTAHLFLHPALEESFGVVIIEAMSLGVPAIGGIDSGGVPWVINNKQLLVNVKNTEEIENAIKKLFQDIDLYKETALNCFITTEKRFSAKHVAKDYLEYYDEILKLW